MAMTIESSLILEIFYIFTEIEKKIGLHCVYQYTVYTHFGLHDPHPSLVSLASVVSLEGSCKHVTV